MGSSIRTSIGTHHESASRCLRGVRIARVSGRVRGSGCAPDLVSVLVRSGTGSCLSSGVDGL